jgi:hypothetical protein
MRVYHAGQLCGWYTHPAFASLSSYLHGTMIPRSSIRMSYAVYGCGAKLRTDLGAVGF